VLKEQNICVDCFKDVPELAAICGSPGLIVSPSVFVRGGFVCPFPGVACKDCYFGTTEGICCYPEKAVDKTEAAIR
jgi:hypothetical protein